MAITFEFKGKIYARVPHRYGKIDVQCLGPVQPPPRTITLTETEVRQIFQMWLGTVNPNMPYKVVSVNDYTKMFMFLADQVKHK